MMRPYEPTRRFSRPLAKLWGMRTTANACIQSSDNIPKPVHLCRKNPKQINQQGSKAHNAICASVLSARYLGPRPTSGVSSSG